MWIPRALPFAAAAVVSGQLLFSPGTGSPPPFPYADKLAHLLIFAGLMVAALPLGRHERARRPGLRAVTISHRVMVTVLLVYAAVSELLQGALPINRGADPLDSVADALGILLVLLLVTGSRAVSVPARGVPYRSAR